MGVGVSGKGVGMGGGMRWDLSKVNFLIGHTEVRFPLGGGDEAAEFKKYKCQNCLDGEGEGRGKYAFTKYAPSKIEPYFA